MRTPGLETRLELRPARFALGLGEPVAWEALKEALSAPMNAAFYLGRVQEVVDDEVIATVWERPSGREATTTLSVTEHLEGHKPSPGSLLRIWTWIELPGRDQRVPRLRVKVEAPHLTESERQELRDTLEELKENVGRHRKA